MRKIKKAKPITKTTLDNDFCPLSDAPENRALFSCRLVRIEG